MKIRKGFVLREIADTIVVVPTGELINEMKGMIHLNITGKFIWELLEKEDLTIEEIANRLMKEYGAEFDRERAMQSTEKFVQKLKDANVLEI